MQLCSLFVRPRFENRCTRSFDKTIFWGCRHSILRVKILWGEFWTKRWHENKNISMRMEKFISLSTQFHDNSEYTTSSSTSPGAGKLAATILISSERGKMEWADCITVVTHFLTYCFSLFSSLIWSSSTSQICPIWWFSFWCFRSLLLDTKSEGVPWQLAFVLGTVCDRLFCWCLFFNHELRHFYCIQSSTHSVL